MIYKKEKELLGTQISIIINLDNNKENLNIGDLDFELNKAFNEASLIEKKYSRFIKGNELHYVNSNQNKWIGVSNEFFELLKVGKILEQITEGTFSLGVKGILDAWGYNENYELGKETLEIKVGEFELNEDKKMIYLKNEIEIGAIGKGYAIDKMIEKLSKFDNFFINAGGDAYAKGIDENNNKWRSYLHHPTIKNKVIGEITLDNSFLAGSSPMYRKWRDKHHLVNVKEKKPVNDILSIFIKGKSGLLTDGYSTAIFSLGYNNAIKFMKKNGIKGLIISSNEDIYVSDGFDCILYHFSSSGSLSHL